MGLFSSLSKKYFFSFLLCLFSIVIIIIMMASDGWIDTPVYTADASSGTIVFKEAGTLTAGLVDWKVTIGNRVFTGKFPDDSPLLSMERMWEGGRFILGFGAAGLFTAASAIGILLISLCKDKPEGKYYAVLALWLSAGLLVTGCCFYAFKLGLSYAFIVMNFFSFAMAVAASFALYGLAEGDNSSKSSSKSGSRSPASSTFGFGSDSSPTAQSSEISPIAKGKSSETENFPPPASSTFGSTRASSKSAYDSEDNPFV